MEFQRARTEDQIAGRQKEIIAACDAIYREKGYAAAHFKAISGITSISRPSIYNYYKTKEEIFLDVLKLDYQKWEKELKAHYKKTQKMNKKGFCAFLSKLIARHEKYLELVTIYIHPIEVNSRLEKLTSFKTVMHGFFETLLEGVNKYFPRTANHKKQAFLFNLMVMVTGAYSYTHLSEKQIQASLNADPEYKTPVFRRIVYSLLMMLLRDF